VAGQNSENSPSGHKFRQNPGRSIANNPASMHPIFFIAAGRPSIAPHASGADRPSAGGARTAPAAGTTGAQTASAAGKRRYDPQALYTRCRALERAMTVLVRCPDHATARMSCLPRIESDGVLVLPLPAGMPHRTIRKALHTDAVPVADYEPVAGAAVALVKRCANVLPPVVRGKPLPDVDPAGRCARIAEARGKVLCKRCAGRRAEPGVSFPGGAAAAVGGGVPGGHGAARALEARRPGE